MTLQLSHDLELPDNAVTQKLAFLGISGSGKTYGAGKFTEELLGAGAQVVVIDTIGNWWGLRLGADGKKPGIAIPVFGGERGDHVLESTGGALVADLVADTRSSMILDVSDFTIGEQRRFVTAFANALLRAKKRKPSPVMIIWEECQDLVPQKVYGEVALVLGAVEKLIKKGRNYGVGTTLISQRSAAVNKDVLSQVETLFAFRVLGKHDRDAIQAWIVSHSIDVGEMADGLAALPTGTCFCWSPQWLQVLKKVRIGKKRTFDASATPEFGDQVRAGELAPIDLQKFERAMKDTIEKAKAEDPVLLRRRIAELEAAARKPAPAPPAPPPPKVVKVPALKEGQLARLEKVAAKLAAAVDTVSQGLCQVHFASVPPPPPAPAPRAVASAQPPRPSPAPRSPAREGDPIIKKGAREMLRALASRHPTSLTRDQVGTLAGIATSGGTFTSYLSTLRLAGYVLEDGGLLAITPTGFAFLGPAAPRAAATTEELVALWSRRFKAGARTMLRILVDTYPQVLSRQDLGEQAGIATTGGTFTSYLSSLRRAGLLDEEGGGVRASRTLFP